MSYECFDCDVQVELHDYCGDYFGMTTDKEYICPSCGKQYQKKEHGNFEERKKTKAELRSKRIFIEYYATYETSIKPLDKIKYEGEIFEKTEKRNNKGNFIYEVVESIYEEGVKYVKAKEIEYVSSMIEKTSQDFFERNLPHASFESKHDSKNSHFFINGFSLNDLKELNYRYKYGQSK